MAKNADELGWAVNDSPVGVWVTSIGTADALMHDTLCMRSNGTGYLRSQSALRGTETLPIMWRHERPGLLKIAMLLPGDDPRDAPEWESIRYAAATMANDLGSNQVLKNTDNDVFWMLAGPIALVSKIPD